MRGATEKPRDGTPLGELAVLSLLAVGAGFLYGACFPPRRWWPLAWLVLVPLLVMVRDAGWRRCVWLAAVFALAGTYATVDWLPRTVMGYFGQPAVAGVGLFLAVALVMVVPPVVAFALIYRILAIRPSALLPVWTAAAWTATEFARAKLWTGNPWVLLGYSQVRGCAIVQIADLAGVYGIGFVVAAANAAVAECWIAARKSTADMAVAVRGLGIAAILFLAALAYGSAVLAMRPKRDEAATEVVVAQGNIDLGARWRPELYGHNLEAYLRLTADALRSTPARLVVWPENAMTFYLAHEPLYRAAIGDLLSRFDAQLLAGGPHWVEGRPRVFHNSAFVLSPRGEIVARYDKEKLLPFGEYFPLPLFASLRKRFVRTREFSPGETAAPLPTVAGAAGILICNEVMFPEIARRRVLAGAEILVNLSNDSWMGSRKFAEIVFDMSVLRAIELRRHLIRSSTSGPSAIVDPYGVVLGRTEIFKRQWARGRVRSSRVRTVYARYGDLFVWCCALAVSIAVVLRLRRWGRGTRTRSR